MHCPVCHEASPGDARFCGSCGEQLEGTLSCPGCTAANPRRNRFCEECGSSLRGDRVAEAPGSERSARHGERRQLSVMFCDLVESTQLSEALELEDLQDVMGAFQDACGEVIERFDGQIAQVLGFGLLV